MNYCYEFGNAVPRPSHYISSESGIWTPFPPEVAWNPDLLARRGSWNEHLVFRGLEDVWIQVHALAWVDNGLPNDFEKHGRWDIINGWTEIPTMRGVVTVIKSTAPPRKKNLPSGCWLRLYSAAQLVLFLEDWVGDLPRIEHVAVEDRGEFHKRFLVRFDSEHPAP